MQARFSVQRTCRSFEHLQTKVSESELLNMVKFGGLKLLHSYFTLLNIFREQSPRGISEVGNVSPGIRLTKKSFRVVVANDDVWDNCREDSCNVAFPDDVELQIGRIQRLEIAEALQRLKNIEDKFRWESGESRLRRQRSVSRHLPRNLKTARWRIYIYI